MSFNMNDAQQVYGFVYNQALAINTETYETRYPEYDYGRLVFVDESSPEWSGGILTFTSDTTGKAKWVSAGAKDVPYADVNRSKIEKSFHMAAIGYEFDEEELGRSSLEGRNITAERGIAARRAYEQFMYNLAIRGDTEKGLGGLVNYSGVTAANVPNDGTGTSRLWSTKTPALILRDINLGLTGIYTGSLTVEMADTILLPIDALTYIAETPFNSGTNQTILSFILENNIYTRTTGQPLTVRAVRGLENDGDSSTGRMVVYKNDRTVAKLHLPMRFRFADRPWQDGPFHFSVPGKFRTGGVEILRSAAFRYLDGIVA